MNQAIPYVWGIRIMAAWAVTLCFAAITRLLLLSEMSMLNINEPMWLLFIGYVIAVVAFAASAYALWQHLNWGRILFVWLTIIWSIGNILGLLSPFFLDFPMLQTPAQLSLDILRYVIGCFLPVIYLNLASVKLEFKPSAL